MIHFKSVTVQTFLNEYWQKKPLVMRGAIPHFSSPLTPDELAGLALEEDIESRIVIETPAIAPQWHLKRGPFSEEIFAQLPKTNWTLLVQGVDRVVPEVMLLLDYFNFIPSWRVDDVMISFAVKEGSIGPHYDHYDVFLFQASGRRKWSLTTKDCHPDNYLKDVDLRIMAQFEVQEEYILEPGDMLYLPAHVGHHGVSLSDDCMTYSFGYRSYRALELWNDFGDFMTEKAIKNPLYQDPNWANLSNHANIPTSAYIALKESLQNLLNDEQSLKTWFGSFVTRPDRFTEQHMPVPIEERQEGFDVFIEELNASSLLVRDGSCRMATMEEEHHLFVNGELWDTHNVSWPLVIYVTSHRELPFQDLQKNIMNSHDQQFLYKLWAAQCLQWY